MKKYTVYLQRNRKTKLNPDNKPIEIKNVLSGTLVNTNSGSFSQRLILFTSDGKTHMYQTDLFRIKVIPA